jgi:Na+/melibiose symporter-like transporter
VDAARPAPSAAVRGWLLLAGLVLTIWGAALFVTPTAPYPLVFNWPQDELSSRLIAAMLMTVAVAFFLSRRDAGLARLALLFAGVYGIGVVAAGMMNAVGGKPMPLLYVTGFGTIGLVSLGLLAGMKGLRISPQAAS